VCCRRDMTNVGGGVQDVSDVIKGTRSDKNLEVSLTHMVDLYINTRCRSISKDVRVSEDSQ